MKVAVIGSRGITTYPLHSIIPSDVTSILSGGAAGVDTIAREFALSNSLPIEEIRPEYSKYGRSAPIIRNKEILEKCDVAIIIWDSISRGTKFCIDYARKINKPYQLFIV